MLPIIRRIRHPLLPVEPANTAPVVQSGVGVSPASPGTLPAPETIPSSNGAHSPSSPSSACPKLQVRSDSGQKRSDSTPQPAGEPRPSTPSPQPTTACPQPSTLNPQPAWSLQPNEPAADYQLFAAWLQLPAPRHLRKAATALGCSLYRLRRLSARHHWKSRGVAFDNHRAHAASRALDQLLREEASDWEERAQRFRLQEWLLHEDILQAASAAARQLRKHPNRASLSDIAKLYELASALGRRACGMPLDTPLGDQPEPPARRPEVEAALDKIYGRTDPTIGLSTRPG